MAWKRLALRSIWHLGRQRGLPLLVVLGLGLGAGLGRPPRCEAARLDTFLTARDRARPVLLAETGLPIRLRSLTHPDPAALRGTVPAYLAFPLSGGEHLPGGIPVLTAAPRAGEPTVGPLDLDPLVRAQLDAALETSRMAVVATPHRDYAVEFLPRYARTHAEQWRWAAQASLASAGAAGAGSGQAATSPSTAATQPNPTIEGIPLSDLERWAKLGSSKLVHWTAIGVNDLSKTLEIGNPRATARKPDSNLAAAQVLAPPLGQETSAAPLPAPVPEPSTWLVFGLIFGAAGWRRWAGTAG